jgi:hypothetical protein
VAAAVDTEAVLDDVHEIIRQRNAFHSLRQVLGAQHGHPVAARCSVMREKNASMSWAWRVCMATNSSFGGRPGTRTNG